MGQKMSGSGRQIAGYMEVKDVVERMAPLAKWLVRFKPGCHALTLWRPDIDAIRRFPTAAVRFGITTSAAGLTWRGFALMQRRGSEAERILEPSPGPKGQGITRWW